MSKRVLFCALALLFVAGLTLAQEKGKEGSWTGWITDTRCAANGANAKHADCAKKCVEERNAKLALYTTDDKKVYVLDPQDKAADHVAHRVTVKGTLEGDTIKVTSIETAEEKGGAEKP